MRNFSLLFRVLYTQTHAHTHTHTHTYIHKAVDKSNLYKFHTQSGIHSQPSAGNSHLSLPRKKSLMEMIKYTVKLKLQINVHIIFYAFVPSHFCKSAYRMSSPVTTHQQDCGQILFSLYCLSSLATNECPVSTELHTSTKNHTCTTPVFHYQTRKQLHTQQSSFYRTMHKTQVREEKNTCKVPLWWTTTQQLLLKLYWKILPALPLMMSRLAQCGGRDHGLELLTEAVVVALQLTLVFTLLMRNEWLVPVQGIATSAHSKHTHLWESLRGVVVVGVQVCVEGYLLHQRGKSWEQRMLRCSHSSAKLPQLC